ncbi:restriction endonuclease subunit S [Bacteroides caccae]|uniref:restriction endonuclease subunit S n=1 Tax=Bacteroides caccae TaxID=47678 RepID=UPI0034A28BE9
MSQFIEMFGNPVTNTKGWKTAKIKDVAPEMPSKEQLSGKIWLLNLDMIESDTGRIIEKVYEDVENALSVQSFDEGNVLFSKLRPYLNKVVIPDEPGMATTELVPLRPEPSKLHKVFLSHLLRGNQFVNYANDIAGGTKMPRMPLTELRNFDCILPPMDKQLEFVFIAEQVDKSKFGDFKSQFVEMFGNTPMSYEMQDCFSLIRNGANIKQGQFEGGIPITRIETISDEIVDRQKMGYAGIADNKYELYYLQDGDILISHINSLKHIGKCALYNKKENESIIHGMNLLCLRPNIVTINPVFAIHMLRSNIIRKGITDITKPAVNQASFSAKDFGKLRTIIPPMDKQMLFVSIAEQADKSKSVIQKALVYLNDIQSDELGKIA